MIVTRTYEEDNMTEFDIEKLKPYTVKIPEEYKKNRYQGSLKGFYIPETKTFNIVTDQYTSLRKDAYVIGQAGVSDDMECCTYDLPVSLLIRWEDEAPLFSVKGDEDAVVNPEYYSLQKDVYSRNTGILEYEKMSDKQGCILGLGSGGFFLGIELVKAGIGSLIVADDDKFEYHNICRHVCGIHDVGKYKVDAFLERAADINPDCKIYVYRDLIQHVDPVDFERNLWKNSIVLCCTDNRHAAYVANELADRYHIPMIDAGCGARASTGEIFYYKPDVGMACYTCAYGEDRGVDHSNEAMHRRFYATETELEKMSFQPGMALDIELTAIFEAKLAIDLLMEGTEGYEMKILPYINQCTILLNFPVDSSVNPYMHLFEEKTPLKWKSGRAEKNPACSYCSKQ